jgi:hypothetical protein
MSVSLSLAGKEAANICEAKNFSDGRQPYIVIPAETGIRWS